MLPLFFSPLSVSEWVLIKLPSGRRLQYYLKPDKRNESGFLSTFKNRTKQQQNDEVCTVDQNTINVQSKKVGEKVTNQKKN